MKQPLTSHLPGLLWPSPASQRGSHLCRSPGPEQWLGQLGWRGCHLHRVHRPEPAAEPLRRDYSNLFHGLQLRWCHGTSASPHDSTIPDLANTISPIPSPAPSPTSSAPSPSSPVASSPAAAAAIRPSPTSASTASATASSTSPAAAACATSSSASTAAHPRAHGSPPRARTATSGPRTRAAGRAIPCAGWPLTRAISRRHTMARRGTADRARSVPPRRGTSSISSRTAAVRIPTRLLIRILLVHRCMGSVVGVRGRDRSAAVREPARSATSGTLSVSEAPVGQEREPWT